MPCIHEGGTDPCERYVGTGSTRGSGTCKVLSNQWRRARYLANREEELRNKREYAAENQEVMRKRYHEQDQKRRPKRYAYNAQRRGLTWQLTDERVWWLVDRTCVYCGMELAGGIDRVKNEFGYTVLNSVPCCKLCNFAKRASPAPDYIAHCARVVAHNASYEQFKTRWVETRTSGPGIRSTDAH